MYWNNIFKIQQLRLQCSHPNTLSSKHYQTIFQVRSQHLLWGHEKHVWPSLYRFSGYLKQDAYRRHWIFQHVRIVSSIHFFLFIFFPFRCQVSCVRCHVPGVTCHVAVSPLTCYMSPVTCYMSPVTCYMSPVACHLSQKKINFPWK